MAPDPDHAVDIPQAFRLGIGRVFYHITTNENSITTNENSAAEYSDGVSWGIDRVNDMLARLADSRDLAPLWSLQLTARITNAPGYHDDPTEGDNWPTRDAYWLGGRGVYWPTRSDRDQSTQVAATRMASWDQLMTAIYRCMTESHSDGSQWPGSKGASRAIHLLNLRQPNKVRDLSIKPFSCQPILAPVYLQPIKISPNYHRETTRNRDKNGGKGPPPLAPSFMPSSFLTQEITTKIVPWTSKPFRKYSHEKQTGVVQTSVTGLLLFGDSNGA